MPTVIVLDVSYSMSRNVGVEKNTILQLAIHGINSLLEYLTNHYKLEFVSVVIFSSVFKVISNFTRDYNSIREKLNNIEEYDRTSIETALHEVNNLVLNEWGNTTPCQVILLTDGCVGQPHILSPNRPSPLPFSFPGKLHVLCLSAKDDPQFIQAKPVYDELLSKSSGPATFSGAFGGLYCLEAGAGQDRTAVQEMVRRLAEHEYREFRAALKCGKLQCRVLVCPPPEPYTEVSEHQTARHVMSPTLELCGFLSVADVGSPMAVSRHLLLPAPSAKTASPSVADKEDKDTSAAADAVSKGTDKGESTSKVEDMQVDEDITDEGRQPSFCVLLHGALRKESMVGLVFLGADWYGLCYAWSADSRKKSNLMLCVLKPGNRPLPWLGDFRCLGTKDQITPEDNPQFPVRPAEKRSYSQSTVSWIKHAGLQSDIQKILRHARKLPEKTSHFYKELNRIRRAAVSFGFTELLEGLAAIFERECSMLPSTSNPDCALQLTHAAQELKKPHCHDLTVNIVAVNTKYNLTQRV